MRRHVPNMITGGRLILAVIFFALLSGYQYEGRGDPTLLNVAFVIYAVALFTDFLDGYLARKWQVEGAFGRIVDPFVDKILVLGSFAFFAGKNFIIPLSPNANETNFVAYTITGVYPAIVVILIARELLVTTFRGVAESSGQNFGAAFAGKVKMTVQSITILVILAYVNYYAWFRDWEYVWYVKLFRDVCIGATVVITLQSGLTYLIRGVRLLRDGHASA